MSRGNKAAVLHYHRVASVETDPWRLAVEPARFAEHLEVIASRFRPLALPELIRSTGKARIPSGAVSVTFDDGYRDNLEVAKPLLERYGVPATVFVITGYLDSECDFWWDELLGACPDGDYDELHRELQSLPPDEREARLNELAAGDGADARRPQTLTSEELARLAEGALVEVGSHTVTHPLLSRLSQSERLDELRSSKQHLEGVIGQEVAGFSYPYGDCMPDAVGSVRAAGFSYACTSVRDVVTLDTDPLELPRLDVGDVEGQELERWLWERVGP